MASLDCVLQILRIMVGAANDDEIFQPPCDRQLRLFEKSEIARAQKRTFARGQMRAKCLGRFRISAPIAMCDTGTRNPDFSDTILRTYHARFRIDNLYAEARGNS